MQANDKKPPYIELANKFREQIRSGALENGCKLEPIRVISERENLSRATVSKAMDLLERDALVRKKERSGIYVQGIKADAQPVAKLIGLISPSLPGMSYTKLITQVQTSIQQKFMRKQNRVSLHACRYHRSDDPIWHYVPADEFRRCGLDGIITLGIFSLNYFAELVTLNTPICAYDVDASAVGVDSVFVNHTRGAFELTRHFIEAGHKDIIFIGGSLPGLHNDRTHTYDPSAVERAAGYRLAMHTLAPELPCRVYHNRTTTTIEEDRDTAERALNDAPETTAIVSEDMLGHPDIEKRGIAQAWFSGKSASVEKDKASASGKKSRASALALCDFDAMEDLALGALNKRMENPFRPIQRLWVEPEIKVCKG